MPFTYEYPRPSLTVDCIIFGLDASSRLKVLLIQRGHDPFKDHWALPGGFVDMEEDLEAAALRELKEETGVDNVFIEQLFTFGKPNRDPRGRVVSVAYFALVNLDAHKISADTDAIDVKWFDVRRLPTLAFDHQAILDMAIERLRGKVRYQPIGFELLPEHFTLTQLQNLYETILGLKLNTGLNKRNFRTKILKMDILKEVAIQKGVAHRPAVLYQFDKARYEEYLRKGFLFEITEVSKTKTKALLLIDLQIDFCPGGALEVQQGDQVIPIANKLMERFDVVVATQDWHPANHESFAANHPWRKPGQIIDLYGLPQVLWTIHCVQDSFGAHLHPGLHGEEIDKIIRKGMNPQIDSYSGFYDNGGGESTGMQEYLQSRGVTEVYVMGLATDYCVRYTVLHALQLGYKTYLIEDGCRGVNLSKGDVEQAIQEMVNAGATIIHSQTISIET